MRQPFSVKPLFNVSQSESLALRFGLKVAPEKLITAIGDSFSDYILLALSEEIETRQQRDQHYQEAIEHLAAAASLLRGQPHPAGGMATKIDKMKSTLRKVIDNQSEIAEERARRFVELNLVRRLRSVWQCYTNTPFYAGLDGSGRSPHDFLRVCFDAAAVQYPEISWFSAINDRAIDFMLRASKN